MIDDVSGIIRRVATAEVVARFRSLAADEIDEKSPGDLVTVADRACELALIPELRAVRDVPVVGEESVAENPSVLEALTAPACWVVDPVDGTSNFVDGSPDFAVMIGYVEHGVPLAGWIWLPMHDVMVVAERGSGAWRNGRRVCAQPGSEPARAIVKDTFVADSVRSPFTEAFGALERLEDRRCAGVEYLALVAGEFEALAYWRTNAWDHVPGAVIAAEAELRVGRFDGLPYRVDDGAKGLLSARPEVWAALADRLGPIGR